MVGGAQDGEEGSWDEGGDDDADMDPEKAQPDPEAFPLVRAGGSRSRSGDDGQKLIAWRPLVLLGCACTSSETSAAPPIPHSLKHTSRRCAGR